MGNGDVEEPDALPGWLEEPLAPVDGVLSVLELVSVLVGELDGKPDWLARGVDLELGPFIELSDAPELPLPL